MKILGHTFILFILLLTACKNDSNPIKEDPISQDGQIIPLAVGNEWKYVDSLFNEEGEFTGTSSFAIKITEGLKINNIDDELFIWDWQDSSNNDSQGSKSICGYGEHGFYLYGAIRDLDTTIFSPPTLYAKYPVSEEETWQHELWVYITTSDTAFWAHDSITIKCLSINEEFSTPYGKFDCVVFDTGLFFTGTIMYYSENIGIVGIIGIWNGVMRYKRVLQEYQIFND